MTQTPLTGNESYPGGDARFRSLVENLLETLVILDGQGRLVYASPSHETLTGYPNAERIGRDALELIHPEDAPALRAALGGLIANADSTVDVEVRILHRSGEWRTLECRGKNLLHDPAIGGIVVSAKDVTDRKRIEEQLRVERAYFYELFEGAPEAILIVSLEDRVIRLNSEFTRLFGYTQEEAVGKPVNDLIVPDDLREQAETLTRKVGSGERINIESVRRHKDGHLINVSVLSRPVAADQSSACYVIYRDISARKESERALRESEQQLRQAQKMDAVGRLAGGIAHDFNTLLTAMTGHAELLLENDGLPEIVRDELEEICRAGNRAVALTRQLLTFSRNQVVQPKVIDLDATVRDLEGMFRRLIGEDVAVDTSYGAGSARILADRGQIEQVVLNLVLNARDAMPAGGRLTIETRPVLVHRGKSHIHGGVEAGRYLLLSVTDTGLGMTEETISRAFEPFYSTKEPGKGTGLGLSTVYGIIAQAGGGIALESDRGHGTNVRIYLPLAEQEAPLEAVPEVTAPRHGTETVLLAEDEAAVRSLVRRILSKQGYRVIEAEHGAAALHLCETYPEPIDLLLTDVIMPHLSGRKLVERCAVLRPTMRVLYMSGYNEDEIMHHGVREQGMPFLQKPFSPIELARKVRDTLDSAEAVSH